MIKFVEVTDGTDGSKIGYYGNMVIIEHLTESRCSIRHSFYEHIRTKESYEEIKSMIQGGTSTKEQKYKKALEFVRELTRINPAGCRVKIGELVKEALKDES